MQTVKYSGAVIVDDSISLAVQTGMTDYIHFTRFSSKVPGVYDGFLELHKVADWPIAGPTLTSYGLSITKDLALAVASGAASAQDFFKFILSGNDRVQGSTFNDVLFTHTGHDVLVGQGGNDKIDGGNGLDVAWFSGKRSEYIVEYYQGKPVRVTDTVAGRDGTDDLIDIEGLYFSDMGVKAVFFDPVSIPGDVYRMYSAAFGRTPDASGLSYWTKEMVKGSINLRDLAYNFMASNEFKAKIGVDLTNEKFVEKLYTNVLFRAPEVTGVNYWVGELAKGYSRIDVLAGFTNSQENIEKTAGRFVAGLEVDGYFGIW